MLVEGTGLVEVGLDVGAADLGHVGGRLEFATVVLGASDAAMGDGVVAQTDLAGLAVLGAMTGEAAIGVIGEDDRHDLLAHGENGWGVGTYGHTVGDWGAAGEREAAGALDLDDAGAATSVGRQTVDIAEVGDVKALLLDHFDERTPLFNIEGLVVDGDAGHGRALLSGAGAGR